MNVRTALIGDVCELNPRMPKGLDDNLAVSFLPMAAVSENGDIAFEEERRLSDVKKGYTYFERGDVLVAKITPCFENGKAARTIELDRPLGFGSTEFHVLRASDDIDPNYLFHRVWNSSFRDIGSRNMTGSAGQKRVPTDFLRRLEIPLPPLDEQRRIATILDKADALRRKRQRALDLLDGLTQSIFLEMFARNAPVDWPNMAIDEVALNMRTGPFGSQLLHSEFTETGVPVLGIDNAVSNEFRWSERRFISEAKYQQLKRYTVQPRDVLITIMGTCGRCAVVPDDIPMAINTKHLCCITLDQKLCLSEFLHAAFLYDPLIQKQLGVQAKGAVMPGLNMGIVNALRMILPPLEAQEQYVERVRLLKRAIDPRKYYRGCLDSLFASLQARAFSGQL